MYRYITRTGHGHNRHNVTVFSNTLPWIIQEPLYNSWRGLKSVVHCHLSITYPSTLKKRGGGYSMTYPQLGTQEDTSTLAANSSTTNHHDKSFPFSFPILWVWYPFSKLSSFISCFQFSILSYHPSLFLNNKLTITNSRNLLPLLHFSLYQSSNLGIHFPRPNQSNFHFSFPLRYSRCHPTKARRSRNRAMQQRKRWKNGAEKGPTDRRRRERQRVKRTRAYAPPIIKRKSWCVVR